MAICLNFISPLFSCRGLSLVTFHLYCNHIAYIYNVIIGKYPFGWIEYEIIIEIQFSQA